MRAKTKTPALVAVPLSDEGLFAEERKMRILDELATRGKVTVAALARAMGVSGVTIRSYLRDLDRDGLLMRTHGGALARTKTGFEPDARQKEVQNLDAKRRIAQAALDLIDDGDTIILDTGTTTLELARCLAARRNLTVVTNDLVIARLLEDQASFSILFLGGVVRKGFHCTVGIQGREWMAGLTADKAFMAANAFSADRGATTPDINQAETKKRMIAAAGKTFLLCDHSKIGKVSFAQFAAPAQIACLVTDRITAAARALIEKRGPQVRVASRLMHRAGMGVKSQHATTAF